MSNMNKQRSYLPEFQIRVIEHARVQGIHDAARVFNVDRKRVREWTKDEEKLRGQERGRKRDAGAGRKLTSEDVENGTLDFIWEQRSKKVRVTRRMIQVKARQIYASLEQEGEFKASVGWVDKFLARNGLVLRRGTANPQNQQRSTNRVIEYVLHLSQLIPQYQLNNIIVMDETPVWFDMPGNTTLDNVGERNVQIRSTGHTKTRVTVALAARATGTKLKPFIIFAGAAREVQGLAQEFRAHAVIMSNSNAWMNDEAVEEWLNSAVGQFCFDKRLLLWDEFRAHTSAATRTKLQRMRIRAAVIPGGCTQYIQAPDVCWNKPFKDRLRQFYDDWMVNGEHTYTPAGNMRPPTRRLLVQWIVDSWQSLQQQLIIDSMKSCAITVAPDGSEDNQIGCFKPTGPLEGGRTLLQERREAAVAAAEADVFEDDVDPITDDEAMDVDEDNTDDDEDFILFEDD